MADRRRITTVPTGTVTPNFLPSNRPQRRPQRSRQVNELRKIFIQTGLVAAASGSAYYELETPSFDNRTFTYTASTIKLSCTVQGPRPLGRNSVFSPNLQLSASIKFAPFSTRTRRGYIRDNIEKDLGSHLQNALNGVIIADRYPKCSIEVAVTVLEGEEDSLWAWDESESSTTGVHGVGLMNVLAGSITVSAAALIDSGIDCLDILTGGVAATTLSDSGAAIDLLDPCPNEHSRINAACVVGFLRSRNEVTEVWSKGSNDIESFERLFTQAIKAAQGTYGLVSEALVDAAAAKNHNESEVTKATAAHASGLDVEMR